MSSRKHVGHDNNHCTIYRTSVLMVLSDFRRPCSCCLFLQLANNPKLAVVKPVLALSICLKTNDNISVTHTNKMIRFHDISEGQQIPKSASWQFLVKVHLKEFLRKRINIIMLFIIIIIKQNIFANLKELHDTWVSSISQ